jgi:hypothetical protein
MKRRAVSLAALLAAHKPPALPRGAVGSAADRSPPARRPRAQSPAALVAALAGSAAAAVQGAVCTAGAGPWRAIPRRRHLLAARSALGLLFGVWTVSLVGVAVTVGGAA